MRAIVTAFNMLFGFQLFSSPLFFGLSGLFFPRGANAKAISTTSSSEDIQSFRNILPAVDGATITRFLISDEDGNATRSLYTYYSANLATGDPDAMANIQRAIVMIHGVDKDGDTSFRSAKDALGNATELDSDVNEETVAIMAPVFGVPKVNVDEADAKGFKQSVKGLNASQCNESEPLLWKADDWASGFTNSDNPGPAFTSSFNALDQIMQYFDDKDMFPNMQHIVVAGHSAGGQTTQRFASVGKDLNLSTSVSYWIGNPGSFVWYNEDRPLSIGDCDTFDDWRNGLSNFTSDYASDVVSEGRQAVLDRWYSRSVTLARGLDDNGDQSSDCGPLTTGATRGQRMGQFLLAFPSGKNHTLDLNPEVGHDEAAMLSTEAGMARLFFDNFSGEGTRAENIQPSFEVIKAASSKATEKPSKVKTARHRMQRRWRGTL